MTGKKKIMVIAFGLFLAFMTVCTMVAKGIYTSGLPRVTTGAPQRKNISHSVNASGMVRQGQEYGVYTEQGLRVATVAVHTGEAVEAGTPLFQIDLPDLERVIGEKELSLEKLAAQQQETASAADQEERKEELEVSRSGQDYQKALRDAELMLQRKRQLLREAQKELEDYRRLPGAGEQVSSGDAQEGQSGKLKELEQAVTVCNQAVEDAILAKEDALVAANRAIENAALDAEESGSGLEEVNRLELLYQRKALERLRELYDNQGWICAEAPGTITDQKLKVGERTPDGACLLYALDEGQRVLEVLFTREQEKYVELGDQAELSYRSATGALAQSKGLVSYLSPGEEGTLARIELTSEDVSLGQPVSVNLTKASEQYEYCVPAGAVGSELTGGRFVYLAEEQEGILGTQWRIIKVPVKVLEQNDTFAAIESSAITRDSRIVESHSKEIAEGDVVRLVE